MTWPTPPQLPGEPRTTDDPTGLRYDRGDLDDTTTRQAGDGWPITGRGITVQFKDCGCGVLVGEYCDCAEFAAGLGYAPVIVMPAFNLRQLAEQHVTAAEQDRRERGAA